MASFLGPQRFEVIQDRDKFERELVRSRRHGTMDGRDRGKEGIRFRLHPV